MKFTGDPTCQVCCAIARERSFYQAVIGLTKVLGGMARLLLKPVIEGVEGLRAATVAAEVCPKHGRPFTGEE